MTLILHSDNLVGSLSRNTRRAAIMRQPVAFGLLSLALGVLSNLTVPLLSLGPTPHPVIFLPVGVGIGLAMLSVSWRQKSISLGCFLAGSFIWRHWFSGSAAESVADTGIMLIEMLVAVTLASSLIPDDRYLRTFKGVALFITPIATVACMAGGLVVLAVFRSADSPLVSPELLRSASLQRMLGDLTGMMLATPVTLGLFLAVPMERRGWRFVESAAILTATAAVSLLAFANVTQSEGLAFALAFAPVPTTLYAAMRKGHGTVAWSMLIIGCCLIAETRRGHGPFSVLVNDRGELSLTIQCYMAMLTGSSMLLGAAALSSSRATLALKRSEAGYRAFVQHSVEGVWRCQFLPPIATSLPPPEQVRLILERGRVVECNDAMARMFGVVDAASLIGQPLSILFPDALSHNDADLKQFIANVYRIENSVTRQEGHDGTPRIFANSLVGVIEDHRLTTAWGIRRDTTTAHLARTALEQSERRWRALIETAPHVAIQGYDVQGRVLFWNPAAEKMFGYSAHQMIGQTLENTMLDSASTRYFEQLLRDMSQTGAAYGPAEWNFRRPDGSTGVVLASLFPTVGPGGSMQFVCMDYDVTERVAAEREHRLLEEQLRHTQKFESLGVMAGGIAHDFNNLLVGVLGNSALAASQLQPDHPAAATLRNVQDAARRAADLTKQLLAYAGKGGGTPQQVNVGRVAESLMPLLRSMSRGGVQITFERGKSLPPVLADETQIEQVLMNLVTNAVEACIEGRPGLVSVRIRSLEADAALLSSGFMPAMVAPGRYVSIEVQDNGKGITPEERGRLFDPFFSTKFTGRGLGLSVVLGIIRGHSGAIQVTSTPGAGSTFHVLLPAETGDEAEASVQIEATAPAMLSQELRAMIVDDDPMVTNVLRLMLESMGWRTDSTCSALDAEQVLTLTDEHSVAILDVTMPEMNGPELAARIRRIRPGITIILSSGYSAESLESLPRGLIDGFIAKPYSPEALLEVMMSSIEARQAANAQMTSG